MLKQSEVRLGSIAEGPTSLCRRGLQRLTPVDLAVSEHIGCLVDQRLVVLMVRLACFTACLVVVLAFSDLACQHLGQVLVAATVLIVLV